MTAVHATQRVSFVRGALVTATFVLLGGCSSTPPQAEPPAISWEQRFEYPVRFQRIIDEQLLVVGTSRHLFGLDPRTGRQLWRARNVSARSDDVIAVPGAGYLLVMDAAGGSFDDSDTHILAIDRFDGGMFWESARIPGKVQQAVIDPDAGRLYAVAVRSPHGDDAGALADLLPGKGIGAGFLREPQLLALDLQNGRTLWKRGFSEKVPLRPVGARVLDEKGDWQPERAFDLGLYREPFVAGDALCVSYTGLSCFSATDGTPRWRQSFHVNEDDTALTYSRAVLDGGAVYTSGEGRLQAFDMNNGELIWRSRRVNAIPELQESPDRFFLQLGGFFFNTEKEAWEWQGDFGAMAVDRRSGETLWTWDNADDAVTNLLLFSGRVWLADEDELLALGESDGKRISGVEHGLENPPVIAALNDRGQIVLVNGSEACAIDPQGMEVLWRVRYAPPGPGGWERFSGSLLRFSGNVLRFTSTLVSYTSGLVPAAPGIPIAGAGVDIKLISTRRLVGNLTGRAGRRLSYQADSSEATNVARLAGDYQYFITQGETDERPALAMVELNTGRTERLLALPHSEPDLLIDDATGQIFQASGRGITALRLPRTR